MRNKTVPLLVTLLALIAGTSWLAPALAQSAVGGPKKPQGYIGGPTPRGNPVIPAHSGQSVGSGQPTTNTGKNGPKK
jgi:hypothetical protein